jgi:GcrA cell cycle regulator
MVAELKRLWAAGLSASDIAGELGGGISRCAVLGKVMRLGLTHRKSPQFKPGPPRPKATTRERPVVPLSPSPLPSLPPGAPVSAQKPRMRRLQLLQLQDNHCRWTIGDPRERPFYFCAADRRRGDAYCAFHMDKAFAKPRRV